jgi:hypothetical protein
MKLKKRGRRGGRHGGHGGQHAQAGAAAAGSSTSAAAAEATSDTDSNANSVAASPAAASHSADPRETDLPNVTEDEEECASDGDEGPFDPDADVEVSSSSKMSTLLKKVRRRTGISETDREVIRLIGQHLHNIGLHTSAEVLLAEAGVQLDQTTAASFRNFVMAGEWTKAVKSKPFLLTFFR